MIELIVHKKMQEKVEVDECSVINELKRAYIRSLNSDFEFINEKGFWESWTSWPHGSGTREIYRKATKEEKENIDFFGKLICYFNNLKTK